MFNLNKKDISCVFIVNFEHVAQLFLVFFFFSFFFDFEQVSVCWVIWKDLIFKFSNLGRSYPA